MIPARIVLVLIVGATVAGATPSPVAEHIRAARDAASHILSRSTRAEETSSTSSTSSVTLGGTTYTTYEGCVGGANAMLDQIRQQIADGTSRDANAANAMLAGLGMW